MTDTMVRALKEALDYTRLYKGQTFVVKIGGEILDRPELLDGIAVQLALLDSLSIRLAVVHGGGVQATRLAERLGVPVRMQSGRRVTTPEMLEVTKMVYAGSLSVDLLAALRRQQVRAVGLSGVDAGLVSARRRPPSPPPGEDGGEPVDWGEVGDIEAVDRSVLDALFDRGMVPVISPIAADGHGRPLNVNADGLAVEVAKSLGAAKLLILTTAPGLLRDPGDPASLVAFADPDDLEKLVAEGAVRGGMRPKVAACLAAVRGGVRRTHILDGRVPDSLLLELFTGAGCGTMIVGRREKRDYSEHELAHGGNGA
ncbi:MAG: acetylglutamate kinase [Acidobacteria bacterium]|nr:MAG: acetylglutamate kinase [Acidobacteriota bacterium]